MWCMIHFNQVVEGRGWEEGHNEEMQPRMTLHSTVSPRFFFQAREETE